MHSSFFLLNVAGGDGKVWPSYLCMGTNFCFKIATAKFDSISVCWNVIRYFQGALGNLN